VFCDGEGRGLRAVGGGRRCFGLLRLCFGSSKRSAIYHHLIRIAVRGMGAFACVCLVKIG